jgi:hypothetical protein
MDDPDALLQIQGTAALGTFNSGTDGSGWPGAIGKNAELGSLLPVRLPLETLALT